LYAVSFTTGCLEWCEARLRHVAVGAGTEVPASETGRMCGKWQTLFSEYERGIATLLAQIGLVSGRL